MRALTPHVSPTELIDGPTALSERQPLEAFGLAPSARRATLGRVLNEVFALESLATTILGSAFLVALLAQSGTTLVVGG